MASLKYIEDTNLQTVTLGSNYTSGSGSMSLTAGHGARLPSSGDFWLSYNDGAGTIRIFKVTARSTDTLTVTASSTEGAGDGNVSSGETLRWSLTVAALTQLRADIVAAGALVLLQTQTASSSAALNFTSSISSTYDEYVIEFLEILPATDGTGIGIQVSTDGGSTYVTTSSYHWSAYATTGSGAGANGSISDTKMNVASNQDSATGSYALSGSVKLFAPASTTNFKTFTGHLAGVTNAGVAIANVVSWTFIGSYKSTTAINAFRILANSGDLASGIVRCYGIAKS